MSTHLCLTDLPRCVELRWAELIIAVGHRLSRAQATQLRNWATQSPREFIVKGFGLDNERVKLNFECDFEAEEKRIQAKRTRKGKGKP